MTLRMFREVEVRKGAADRQGTLVERVDAAARYSVHDGKITEKGRDEANKAEEIPKEDESVLPGRLHLRADVAIGSSRCT